MSTLVMVSYVLLWIVVAVLVVAVIALYNHLGNAYLSSAEGRAGSGPTSGSLLDPIEAVSVHGDPVLLPPSRPTLIVFVSTTCSLCAKVRQAIPDIAREAMDIAIVVICHGRPAMVRAWASDLVGVAVVADPKRRYSGRYKVDHLPFAIAVGSDGIVRDVSLVNGYDHLATLAGVVLGREVPEGTWHR
jgi:hypothetical protein